MNFVPKNMLVLAFVAVVSAHADEMPMPLKVTISPDRPGDQRVNLRIESSMPTADEVMSNCVQEWKNLAAAKETASAARAILPDSDEAEMPTEATLDGVFPAEEPVDAAQLQDIFSDQANLDHQVMQRMLDEIVREREAMTSVDIEAENIMPEADVVTLPVWQEAFSEKDKTGGAAMTTIAASKLQGYYEWLQARVPSIDKANLCNSLWFGAKVAGAVFVGYMGCCKGYKWLKAWLTKGVADAARELSDAGGGAGSNASASVVPHVVLPPVEGQPPVVVVVPVVQKAEVGGGQDVQQVENSIVPSVPPLSVSDAPAVQNELGAVVNSGTDVHPVVNAVPGVPKPVAEVPAQAVVKNNSIGVLFDSANKDETFFGDLFNEPAAQQSVPNVAGGVGAHNGSGELIRIDSKHTTQPTSVGSVNPSPRTSKKIANGFKQARRAIHSSLYGYSHQ